MLWSNQAIAREKPEANQNFVRDLKRQYTSIND